RVGAARRGRGCRQRLGRGGRGGGAFLALHGRGAALAVERVRPGLTFVDQDLEAALLAEADGHATALPPPRAPAPPPPTPPPTPPGETPARKAREAMPLGRSKIDRIRRISPQAAWASATSPKTATVVGSLWYLAPMKATARVESRRRPFMSISRAIRPPRRAD